MKLAELLDDKRAVLLDIEGTLVTCLEEPELFPDAAELLAYLRRTNKKFLLATNTARMSRAQIAAALRRAGLEVSPREIVTPMTVALELIRGRPKKVFLIGEAGHVIEAAECEWVELVYDESAEIVMLGACRDLTYQQLNFAFRLLLKGAKLIVVGGDLYARGCRYGECGVFLMEGAIARALEEAAGVRGVRTGKPSVEFFRTALSLLGVSAKDALMIGDSERTDLRAAEHGIDVVLVRRDGRAPTEVPKGARVFLARSLKLNERLIELTVG